MRKPVIFITGAAGEIGHGLIDHLARTDRATIVTLDLQPLEPALEAQVTASYTGSILDDDLLSQIFDQHPFDAVYHLAALLSTRAEFTARCRPPGQRRRHAQPAASYAQRQGERQASRSRSCSPARSPPTGCPTSRPRRAPARPEDAWLTPTTMYGCNKLYCEQLGRYYADYYRQLATEPPRAGSTSARSVFPG